MIASCTSLTDQLRLAAEKENGVTFDDPLEIESEKMDHRAGGKQALVARARSVGSSPESRRREGRSQEREEELRATRSGKGMKTEEHHRGSVALEYLKKSVREGSNQSKKTKDEAWHRRSEKNYQSWEEKFRRRREEKGESKGKRGRGRMSFQQTRSTSNRQKFPPTAINRQWREHPKPPLRLNKKQAVEEREEHEEMAQEANDRETDKSSVVTREVASPSIDRPRPKYKQPVPSMAIRPLLPPQMKEREQAKGERLKTEEYRVLSRQQREVEKKTPKPGPPPCPITSNKQKRENDRMISRERNLYHRRFLKRCGTILSRQIREKVAR